jgi:hypothetical protein
MSYYNKEEIINYVSKKTKELTDKKIEPLNPESEVIKRLNDEEDLVGFFWIDYNKKVEDGQKIIMDGKTWFRISAQIYTDDRFAIDLYHAMKLGITVTDIIKKKGDRKQSSE